MAIQKASPLLKFKINHSRQENQTHEAFMQWLTKEYIPAAIPIFKKHGVIAYSVFVTPPSINSGIASELGKVRPDWHFNESDCAIEYTINDISVIKKLMMDPEWHATQKNQGEFLDSSKNLISLGFITPFLLESGEVVNI